MATPDKTAIVVSIDRLGAPFLGPYGNTWVETPHFNQLASRSVLFEFAVAETVDLSLAFRSYWQGCHALSSGTNVPAHDLSALLQDQGVATALITDDPLIHRHPQAGRFQQQTLLSSPAPAVAADDVGHTEMGRIFAAAIDWLQTAEPPYLLWLHCRGMDGPWDAPLELRNQFADEDDPPPPEFLDPPNLYLEPGFDPDQLLGLTHAYAGQTVLTDICLGALLDFAPSIDDSLLVVTSPRGFALGEHLKVGALGDALFAETLSVPLLMKLPNDQAATLRLQALVQNSDLFATLVAWFQLGQNPATVWGQDLLPLVETPSLLRGRACSMFDDERSIRTPAWFLRASSSTAQLYAKPDDRWEVNDVADRCADVVVELQDALADFEDAVGTNRRELKRLEDTLITG